MTPQHFCRPARPGEASDYEAIIHLETEIFGDAAWGRQSLTETFGNPACCAMLCLSMQDQTLAGFLIWQVAADEAEILLLGVTPGLRRRGLATVLLRQFCDGLIAQSCARVFLEVRQSNQVAIDFYKQNLFESTGRRPRYYKDGDAAILMQLTL